jgi:hypothetical protein
MRIINIKQLFVNVQMDLITGFEMTQANNFMAQDMIANAC